MVRSGFGPAQPAGLIFCCGHSFKQPATAGTGNRGQPWADSHPRTTVAQPTNERRSAVCIRGSQTPAADWALQDAVSHSADNGG